MASAAATWRAAHLQPERDVLAHGEVREQGQVLEHDANRTAVRGHAGHVPSIDHDAPGSWRFEAGDQAQDCGLARTGGPQQADEAAGFNG
jgi:hypothetical protein